MEVLYTLECQFDKALDYSYVVTYIGYIKEFVIYIKLHYEGEKRGDVLMITFITVDCVNCDVCK